MDLSFCWPANTGVSIGSILYDNVAYELNIT